MIVNILSSANEAKTIVSITLSLWLIITLICYQFYSTFDSSKELEIIYQNNSILPPYKSNDLHHWTWIERLGSKKDLPGENGQPFKCKQLKRTIKTSLTKYKVNIYATDAINLDRSLPDHRNLRCIYKSYPKKLPSASIIIVFHNEIWSILLRTIISVINSTPASLLKELILIDDSSSKTSLKFNLKHFIATLRSPIKLIRMGKRSGLIKGRNFAASIASGNVLVFLDSNVECNHHWLQPLLSRILGDRSRVVSPIVDLIDPNHFGYSPVSENYISAFSWQLSEVWLPLTPQEVAQRQDDASQSFRSPATNGGIFAIDRQFFWHLGGHDEAMSYFGYESLDISLWAWCCGGSVEIVTCSRIGHVYRENPHKFPIKKQSMLLYNVGRIVETWLGEYKMFYYHLFPATASIDRGDLSPRHQLQRRIGCKSFLWYLDNVFPESGYPRYYKALGQIEHSHSMLCLDLRSVEQDDGLVRLNSCLLTRGADPFNYFQIFLFTLEGTIRGDNFCLKASRENESLSLAICRSDLSQRWQYYPKSRKIQHVQTKLCMHLPNEESVPILAECASDSNKAEQKFFMRDNFDWTGSRKV